MLKTLLGIALLFVFSTITAQEIDTAATYRIARVTITGNKITRPFIILRECDIKSGDTVAGNILLQKLERNRQRIMNTQLFITTDVLIDSIVQKDLYVNIKVKENLYIFPVPFIRLNDRNMAEWVERGSQFSRLNYGAYVEHSNLFGLKQRALVYFDHGLNTRLLLKYNVPYLFKSDNDGLYSEIRTLRYRGAAVNTNSNRLQFVTIDSTLLKLTDGRIKWRHRSGFYKVHYVELAFSRVQISDTLQKLNPYYLLPNTKKQNWTSVAYTYKYDNRDNVNYSLKGLAFIADIRRIGILPSDNIRFWQIKSVAAYYHPITKKYYANIIAKAKYQSKDDMPYNLQRGIGYEEDFLRGFEVYVINGTKYGSLRFNFKRELLRKKYEFDFMPLRQFRTVPLDIFAVAFHDMGYVHQPYPDRLDNSLANTILRSYGVGVEALTSYNTVIKCNFTYTNTHEFRFSMNLQKDIWTLWN